MCKAAGKEWRRYFELASTKSFIQELSNDAGISGTVLIKQIGLLEANGNPKMHRWTKRDKPKYLEEASV